MESLSVPVACSCWSPDRILVPAGDGQDAIDIVPFLKDCSDPYSSLLSRKRCSKVDCLEFPPSIYPPSWEERAKLEKVIIQAAAKECTNLIRRRTRGGTHTGEQLVSDLVCHRGMTYTPPKASNEFQRGVYEDNDNAVPSHRAGVRRDVLTNKSSAARPHGKSQPRRTVTTRPPPDQLCTFRITILLDPGICWYIARWSGCREHTHHGKPAPGEERQRMASFSDSTRFDAARYTRYGSTGTAAGILHEETGNSFSQSQLRHNKENCEILTGHVPATITTNHKSDAEQTIAFLEKEKLEGKKSYVALYHTVMESTLVTISKADRLREDRRQQEVLTSAITVNLQASDGFTATNSEIAVALSPEEQVQLGQMLSPIKQRLKVGQKILLAIAWVRSDERRLFELFPEVLMLDVTFGTNNEGRPLGVSASTDGELKTFTPVRAFLPSECQWVFHWLWSSAIPLLLGRENLSRVQMVLSDGDSKIYNTFNSVKADIYPSAIHGLCIFHLVSQPLGKLDIREKGDIHVKGMLKTFKLWLFSFMSLSGVETEEEFQVSLRLLRKWLFELHRDTNKPSHLRQNATVLDEFLTKSIMPHKDRWFFPGRNRRMTLDQKATSAVESINQKIKWASGKHVTPSMSLRESLRTMDMQVDRVLRDRAIQSQRQAVARALYARTPTVNVITKEGESILTTQREQSQYYGCRVQSHSMIIMKRLPNTHTYCAECESNSSLGGGEEVHLDDDDLGRAPACCPVHSSMSPIPAFARIRRIEMFHLGPEGDFYEIRCSCLFHPTTGIPCRHIIRLLNSVLPHHIFVRWHKRFLAHYKRPNYESITQEFAIKNRDRRLIVSRPEYDSLMRLATILAGTHVLPNEFWQPVGPVQASSMGILDWTMDDDSDDDDHDDVCCSDDFDDYVAGTGGLLTQEVRLTQDEGNSEKPSRPSAAEHALQQMAVVNQSSSLYQTAMSIISVVCGQVEQSKDNEVESIIRRRLNDMHQEVQSLLVSRYGNERDFSGEFVSPFMALDKRKKFKRKKSWNEPTKRRQKQSKDDERSVVHISENSLLGMDSAI